jgi:PAS domain S-box-containing protein
MPNSSEAQRSEALPSSSLESDERLRLLIDSVHDYAIFTLDTEGRVASWNPGAERLKGYKPHEIVGQHFSRFYPKEDIASGKPQSGLKRALRDGRFEGEGWRIRKDGSRFWALAVISPMRDSEGNLQGFAKITRDLTERKRAEENRLQLARIQETLRMRDQFLAYVSHELRTPLSALHMQLELLNEVRLKSFSPADQEIVDRIGRSYSRMSELVETILEHSRLQAGKIVVKLAPTDLNRLASEVADELRPAADRNRLRLRLYGSPEAPIVETDDRFLRIILTNLLGNAIKFSNRGNIDVTVSQDKSECRISVRDEGPGIPEDDRERIFEPFERLEPLSNKHTPGFGLGLATAKRLSDALGARLELQSEVGLGSTFTITLSSNGLV